METSRYSMALIRGNPYCCKVMLLLQLCGLLATFVVVTEGHEPSSGRYSPIELPDTLQEVFKRGLSEVTSRGGDEQSVNKRAVPPAVAEKAMEIGGELAAKTAEELFNKIGEAGDRAAEYLKNGASVDVKPQNGFMTDDMFAPPAWHVDVSVKDDDNEKEESSGTFFHYPMGVGPMMYNGCYGSNYQPGDPCYNSRARAPARETCVALLDAASFIGVGFDGRGAYSPDSSKMSIIQRNCAGLSTYDGFDVPDTMNVHGIYETKSNMMTFEDRNEYTNYLETEAGVSGSLFFASAGVTAAYGRSEVSNEQKYLSMMDIDVIRYKIFKEVTTANDLSTDFIKEYMSLPTNYHAPGNPRRFQEFLKRWGTHYIESGVFGGRLEIKKVASASFYSSVEQFATEAKYDFDAFFASVHAKTSQKGESTEARQTSYSTVSIEALGGDQEIAAALTDAGSPTIKSDLIDWLDSIPDYPKAIKFGVAPITDLLYFRVEDIFPNKDFKACSDQKRMKKDDEGNTYYYFERTIGNVTVQEKHYCKYESEEELMDELADRRKALDQAISVYMSEGLVSDDEISVPAGSNYCEFSNVEIDSSTGPPDWENIKSGNSFTVIFDLETDIEGGYHGRNIPKDDVVTMHNFVGKWFVEKSDGTARLGDGYGNGGSNDVENHKISVDGLVLTFIPEASMFMLKDEDFTASRVAWPKLYEGLKNMFLARVEWPISLRTSNAEEKNFLNSAVKTSPCNTKWSNIQTLDVSYDTDSTDAGNCLYFSAVSEGSIYATFASVPKDKKTWYFVEISTEVAAIHKYNHVLTETSYMNAKGLGDDVLQQNYFICISLMEKDDATLIEYGKFKDEDTRTIYLSYIDKHSPIVPAFYAFGSGSKDVTIFHAKVRSRTPPASWSTCGPGTTFDADLSLCLLNCDASCDPDYGCMISESGQPSPKLCNECKDTRKVLGTMFECTGSCPLPTILVDGKSICPCKWVVNGDEKECHGTCPSGTHLDLQTNVCIDGCADPGEIENGFRKEGDSFSNGDIVSYKCHYGYFLEGKGDITCLHGAWTSTVPVCKQSEMVEVRWTTDGNHRCRYGLPNGLPNGLEAECDPSGDRPCCSSFGYCGKTTKHCVCTGCIDYRIKVDVRWRTDGEHRCGPGFRLPNGLPSECNPNGDRPCCSSYGYCGSTKDHCTCDKCRDYRKIYPAKTWREDGRCGEGYTLDDGSEAGCDPWSEFTCCWDTHCVFATDAGACACPGCTDYKA